MQIAAGVVDQATASAKYTGLHSLRHFYASWCINRRVDGGLELPLKMVQERLGHASIAMTAGPLRPPVPARRRRHRDGGGERALLG